MVIEGAFGDMNTEYVDTFKIHPVTQAELNEVIRKHVMFLTARSGGARAVLRDRDLSGLSFVGQNLAQSDFTGCIMALADCSHANFESATLFGCDLSKANLTSTDFQKSELGRVVFMEGNFSNERALELTPQTWRWYKAKAPGGPLSQLCVHIFDSLHGLGGPIEAVPFTVLHGNMEVFGFRIGEISCPTKYFKEASSINFRRSMEYGIGVLKTTAGFVAHKMGIANLPRFDSTGRKVLLKYYSEAVQKS